MSLSLSFDGSLALLGGAGLAPNEVASLGAVLNKLRDEMCDIDEKMLAGEIPIPPSKQPLDAGFASLPQNLLAEYEAGRQTSQLGRMLAVTKQLMTEVDRVVVLADRDFLGGPRALMHACCQPHFNQLSRAQRGSRPRMLFVGDSLDNDAVQGALHLLDAHRGRAAAELSERWGLVVIGDAHEPGGASRLCAPFLRALEVNCGGDRQLAGARTIVVSQRESWLHQWAQELGSAHEFSIPDCVGARFSVLSLVGLLPAALLGINIMKLLEGARAVHDHFRRTKAADNLVLQYAAMNYLFEKRGDTSLRCWRVWCQSLQATACWYKELIGGSWGPSLQIEEPRSSGHAERGKSLLLHQVVVDRFRFDPLILPDAFAQEAASQAPVNNLGEQLRAAIECSQQSLIEAGRPTTRLTLPQVDEPCVGQLLQWLMLATVVEARLMGRNPYIA